jgi:Uma2 family endonuclease
MVALAQVAERMSVAEFLAWNPGDKRRWQLIDGVPHAMAPANRTHGTLQGELGRLIGNHLAARRSPCSLVVTPGIVPPGYAHQNMRVPDLAVTCAPYTAEETALTDPVLIVEILSPSNEADTRANVWAYMTIPSVQEILVLYGDRIGAELLRRRPDGTWPSDPMERADGVLQLDCIGLSTDLAAIYAGTRLAQG